MSVATWRIQMFSDSTGIIEWLRSQINTDIRHRRHQITKLWPICIISLRQVHRVKAKELDDLKRSYKEGMDELCTLRTKVCHASVFRYLCAHTIPFSLKHAHVFCSWSVSRTSVHAGRTSWPSTGRSSTGRRLRSVAREKSWTRSRPSRSSINGIKTHLSARNSSRRTETGWWATSVWCIILSLGGIMVLWDIRNPAGMIFNTITNRFAPLLNCENIKLNRKNYVQVVFNNQLSI